MNRRAFMLGVLATGTAVAGLGAQGAGRWTVLFNGTSLDRWTPIGTANWKLADGSVQADMGTGFLVSKESYADFDLRAEFWVTDDANSGVFIRCSNPQEVTAMNAYEVNIFDKRPDQTYRTGAIVDVAKPLAVVNTGGKWSTMEISARGARLTVAIDGTKLVDVEDRAHARGPIALQYGAGTVKFRKVEIR